MRASLLPLGAGALCAALLIAVPVLLTAMLAQDSNRPSIDYIGAARGSLHPALLLTLVMPDVFGAAGRMEDYWGPPSFAWPDTGIFIAQNMGELYIGAIPLLLLLTAAVRGQLWAPEIRFFTCAAGVALLYALGWYTPVFRVPLCAVARRQPLSPAGGRDVPDRRARRDPGGLRRASAARRAPRGYRPRSWRSSRWRRWAGVPALAIGLGLWLGRVPRLSLPLSAALVSFAAAAAALAWAMPRIAVKPLLAAVVLAGVTTVDLAYNNGPSSSTAQPPAMYEVLEPDTRNATIAILKSKVVADATRRDRIELAGPRLPLAQRQPHAQPREHAGLQPLRLALYSRRPAPRTTSACPTSASSPRCSRPIARRWPTCWACASSPPARPSRPWIRA